MSAARRRLVVIAAVAALGLPALRAEARPEYYDFVRERSGRLINCALCHTHSDGPEGAARGQIGTLTEPELLRLQQSRAAFEPGTETASPLLNEFGNALLRVLGKRRLMELRQDPGALAGAYGFESDLDGDGIPDAREYLEGTHPLKASDGAPWQLFLHNFRANQFHLLMIALATVLGVWGLSRLLHGLHLAARPASGPEE